MEQVCPICLEQCTNSVSLCSAGHSFCRACLSRWLSLHTLRSLDCPVCRRHLRPYTVPAAGGAAASPSPLEPLPQTPTVPAAGDAALSPSPLDPLSFPSPAPLNPTAGLVFAMEAGNTDLALAFVQRGAAVSGVPKGLTRSCTPLMWACETGCTALVQELLSRGADCNQRGCPDSRFPLLIAAAGGRSEALQLLLAAGATVDAHMSDYMCAKRTALVAAAAAGQSECVKLLCAARADVNAYLCRDGSSALLLAAARGSLGTVQALLAAGARVNQACEDGTTPLHSAASEGWVETARVLVFAGADLEATRVPYAWTPLQEAAHRLECDIADILLAAGARVNALDALGRSAVAIASERRWASMAIVRVLKRAGGKWIAPRGQAARTFQSLFSR